MIRPNLNEQREAENLDLVNPVLTLFTGPYCVMGLLNGDKESFCALLGNAKLIMVYHTAPMDMAWMAPVGVGAMEMPW